MRRCYPHHALLSRSRSLEILLHQVPQRPDFSGICGSRMSRLPHRAFGEGRNASLLKLGVSLVLKEARLTQRLEQMSNRIADFWASQGAGKLRLQVQACSRPIEQQKAWYQRRRDDQRSVRISKAVANQQPWPVRYWREHDIQVRS